MVKGKHSISRKGIEILLAILSFMIIGLAVAIVVVNINNNGNSQEQSQEDTESDTDSDTDENAKIQQETIEKIDEKYKSKIEEAGSDEEKAAIYFDMAQETSEAINPYAGDTDVEQMITDGVVQVDPADGTIYTDGSCDKVREDIEKAIELNPNIDISTLDQNSTYPCVMDIPLEGGD